MDTVGTMADTSPNSHTEDDMSKVREIFERTLNAIAQATDLAKQVKQLSTDIAQLRTDFDTTQARNVELDRMLHDTREQRDRAEAEAKRMNGELSQTQHEKTYAQNEASNMATKINELVAELGQVKKERDDYGFNVLATQEALDKANAKLASIHQTMGIEFKPFEVPKPEPSAEPEPVVAKVTEPEVKPKPHKVFEGDPGWSYSKADNYDTETGRWFAWSDEL